MSILKPTTPFGADRDLANTKTSDRKAVYGGGGAILPKKKMGEEALVISSIINFLLIQIPLS